MWRKVVRNIWKIFKPNFWRKSIDKAVQIYENHQLLYLDAKITVLSLSPLTSFDVFVSYSVFFVIVQSKRYWFCMPYFFHATRVGRWRICQRRQYKHQMQLISRSYVIINIYLNFKPGLKYTYVHIAICGLFDHIHHCFHKYNAKINIMSFTRTKSLLVKYIHKYIMS